MSQFDNNKPEVKVDFLNLKKAFENFEQRET